MGPMSETDWAGADWLGTADMRRLRFPFVLPANDPVIRASASVDAPSCATIYANGINVNGLAGVCPWTVWDRTTIFHAYNVTEHLLGGANAMGFQLGKARHTAPLRLRLAVRLGLWQIAHIRLQRGFAAAAPTRPASTTAGLRAGEAEGDG